MTLPPPVCQARLDRWYRSMPLADMGRPRNPPSAGRAVPDGHDAAGVSARHRGALLVKVGRPAALSVVGRYSGERAPTTFELAERADDANRRLCNQAFFHRIFIEEDGDVRVEYERPFGSLCDTEEQMNALNWAAEAKKKGEVRTGQRVVTLVEG